MPNTKWRWQCTLCGRAKGETSNESGARGALQRHVRSNHKASNPFEPSGFIRDPAGRSV